MTRKFILLILTVLTLTNVMAQDRSDIDVLNISNQWMEKLSELDDTKVLVPESYMSVRDVQKARTKIESAFSKIWLDIEKNPEDTEQIDNLIFQNTNASLWYSEVTTEDFQVFLRRLVVGRPINKDVIQDLKKTYIKWIKNPSIKNLNRYSQALLETGKSYEILTKLKVSIEDRENTLIKYRPVTDEKIETLMGPVAEKIIPVGNYYVWMERDGKVLSDNTNGYNCIRSWKTIFLNGLN